MLSVSKPNHKAKFIDMECISEPYFIALIPVLDMCEREREAHVWTMMIAEAVEGEKS